MQDKTFEPQVADSRNSSANLSHWAYNAEMPFISEPDIPTHKARHILDLTFSNIPFADTRVRMDIMCGSDHYKLHTTIPDQGLETPKLDQYFIDIDEEPPFANLVVSIVKTFREPS